MPVTTTEQMHVVIAPGVRIEQTRRRLMKLRAEGLVDRIALPVCTHLFWDQDSKLSWPH